MRSPLFLLPALMIACSKPAGPNATSSAPSASVPAAMTASSATPPTQASASPAGTPTTYVGRYTSNVGPFYAPDGGEWAGLKWRGEDAGIGLGEGTLTLTVDPKTGRAEGTGDGPIGAVLLSGILQDGAVSFNLARKDRTDNGLTGSAIGKLSGDKLEGTMNLSLATASVLREATFSLSKK